MVTPLYISSLYLHHKLSSPFFFPNIYYWNDRFECKIQATILQRFPFCFGLVLVIVGITIPFIFTTILYIFNPKSVPVLVIIFGVVYAGLCVPYFVFSYITLRSGKEFAEYITAVWKFLDNQISYEFPSNFVLLVLSHLKLVSLENKRLFSQTKNADIVGLAVANNVLYCSTFNHALVPIAIYLKIDPMYHILENFTTLNDKEIWPVSIRFTLFLARLCLTFIANFELSRNNVFLSSFMLHCLNVLKICAKKIDTNLPNRQNTKKYIELQLILNLGNHFMKPLLACSLCMGFISNVLLSCFMLVGWKVFDLHVYSLLVPLGFVIQVLIFKGLELTVEVYKKSSNTIKHTWPYSLIAMLKTREIISAKFHRKTFKSLFPLRFYAGDLALINTETKRHYYGFTLSYTATMFLIFRSNLT